ncbi:hypothetical protein ACFXTO_022037 [Malus domestica]
MIFDNADQVATYYKTYGRQSGFLVIKRSSTKGDDGKLRYITMCCARLAIDLDTNGHLRNVFWADTRSRAAYEEFGDVVTFGTMYLTNKYDMPFAPFVGLIITSNQFYWDVD